MVRPSASRVCKSQVHGLLQAPSGSPSVRRSPRSPRCVGTNRTTTPMLAQRSGEIECRTRLPDWGHDVRRACLRRAPSGAVLARLAAGDRGERLTHVEVLPPRRATYAAWPDWVHPAVREALVRSGCSTVSGSTRRTRPTLAHAGRHVVVATGTASGKSLAYQLPALSASLAAARVPRGSAGRPCSTSRPPRRWPRTSSPRCGGSAAGPSGRTTHDGDSSPEQRDWTRDHAEYVLTNPDMLHRSLLPGHARWSRFFGSLRYVVVDECHHYRGVFGAHVAQVLRRLRRVCALYGADPTFVLASATVAEPEVLGRPAHRARRSTRSPTTARRAGARRPGAVGAAVRAGHRARTAPRYAAPPAREVADLLTDLVVERRPHAGVRPVAAGRRDGGRHRAGAARRGGARAGRPGGALPRRLPARGAPRAGAGAALRAAARPGRDQRPRARHRHQRPRRRAAGRLPRHPRRAVAAGRPGRARRAGRARACWWRATTRWTPTWSTIPRRCSAGRSRPTSSTRTTPTSSARTCARPPTESPLTEADLPLFGPGAREAVDALTEGGLLRRRSARLVLDRPAPGQRPGRHPLQRRPAGPAGRGRDRSRARHRRRLLRARHRPRGRGLRPPGRDLAGRRRSTSTSQWRSSCARSPTTRPRRARSPTSRSSPSASTSRGGRAGSPSARCEVTHQVVSFLKRRVPSGEVIGEEPLDLPERTLRTTAVWWTLPAASSRTSGLAAADLPGAAHAAEHASIGLLPLFATCDRWDIGGVSTALHPDTGRLTVFVHDGHPGGAGFAERGYAVARAWLRRHPRGDRSAARAPRAAPPACSRPSAATRTTRSTRRARSTCSTCCSASRHLSRRSRPGCSRCRRRGSAPTPPRSRRP